MFFHSPIEVKLESGHEIKHHLMKLGITSQNLKDLIFTRCGLMKNISSIEDASNTNLRTLVRANLEVRKTNLIS